MHRLKLAWSSGVALLYLGLAHVFLSKQPQFQIVGILEVCLACFLWRITFIVRQCKALTSALTRTDSDPLTPTIIRALRRQCKLAIAAACLLVHGLCFIGYVRYDMDHQWNRQGIPITIHGSLSILWLYRCSLPWISLYFRPLI